MYTAQAGTEHPTYQYKLVLLGDTAVGKTSIVIRFSKGSFSEYQESTIGAAFSTQNVILPDFTAKFEIWDTAGQERYHTLAPMYYKGAAAAIVVYDITDGESFDRAQAWIRELHEQCSDDIIIALAGNKIDKSEDRQISTEQGSKYCKDNSLLFMECSAKTNVNVKELFTMIAKSLPKKPVEDSDAPLLLEEEQYDMNAKKKGKCRCNLI